MKIKRRYQWLILLIAVFLLIAVLVAGQIFLRNYTVINGKIYDRNLETLDLSDDLLVMAGDNVLDFSLSGFVNFAKTHGTSCVMYHEENERKKQQKTAIITIDSSEIITSYEEKPKEPKGNLAVPPFYCYRARDVKRIPEALDSGCGYDAPGSFAAWLSKQTPMHAYKMPGKRYDIGDLESLTYVKRVFAACPPIPEGFSQE